ncbi:Uma2 family endonuclease [Streptomyces sp. NPDC006512]|uniref:Uma2 family endonuclease n=1 Tax=Streptomyces sp. NPDC006512 TaxID=3154307 RepID=UPI0033BA4E66
MTALARETATPPSDLDEALWLAWRAAVEKLPEGFHAEIIEGNIEVSSTGRFSHGETANVLRDALVVFLAGSGYAARQDMNVVHGRKVSIPDLFIAPKDAREHVTEDGIGIMASGVELVVEVVSPGHDSVSRDRIRKRRAYARAGIPVYLLIDDHDDRGTVTVLSSPDPEKAVYDDEVRAAYGTAVTIPTGPAKGFTVDESITGAPRGG